MKKVEMRKPSALDKRAAERFQTLANEAAFRSVECRFRRVVRTVHPIDADTGPEHGLWPQGAKEFKGHFGPAANYFAGAMEYIHLATGWKYPHPGLLVMVFNIRWKTSGGIAIQPPGLAGTGVGEIRVFWANGEFTLTVLHELIHLFKVEIGSQFGEDWVEQQALKLTLGI